MEPNADVCRSLLTPLSFIERSAAVYPKKTAVVYNDVRRTYGEFYARVNRLASALRKCGLSPGDRVAFLCPNTPPMLEAHFAVPLAGGVLVCINIRLATEEIKHILGHSGSTFLFVDSEFGPQLAHAVEAVENLEHIIDIHDVSEDSIGGTEYEAFLEEGDPGPVPWALGDEMETICINYTSGTTGQPKGVMFSHRGAYINAIGECLETVLTPESRFLWTVPMFHCNGWCFTWGVTAIGATHVCLRKVDPAEVWRLIEAERVTHLNGAPVVMISLLNHPGRPDRLATPLTATTAGAPPSPTLIGEMNALGARVVHVYGLTETYGPYTVCAIQPGWERLDPAERAQLMARQGVRFAVADGLRVVADDMRDVPNDGQTLGEVVMRGNMVMKGYYNDPDATARAFRGGWFHSGDVAVVHRDGYIELRDRSKDIIISGGENISSIEVEQALYRHDAVLECAVVGAPHEKWGETPRAFVTLKEGANLTDRDLIDFCRTQIAHFKCPTSVEFCPLPKTSTGKIQKFILRDRVWEGQDVKIKGA